ncbi:metallophosphoesterase [Oryzifoliimicrobium ureilyticus]|uniref:metallophosphoesterase n=1 Tax=Oryzifoliimicrobium ureilyticus TaxID=3113724 RepID=UPI003075F12D
MRGLLNALQKKTVEKSNDSIQRPRIDLGSNTPPYAIYAVGDVHGCLKLLQEAEQAILYDIHKNKIPGFIVLLGDYVDRGPDSAQVLDHLLSPPPKGVRRLPLCGNHDELFLHFINDPRGNLDWLEMGGRETLTSYGMDGNYVCAGTKAEAKMLQAELLYLIPTTHIDLLNKMPAYFKIGNYVFVHAGIRPSIPLENQSDEDLFWIREPFISMGPNLPFTFVHGHTPFREPSFGPGRIGIDTGAYVSGKLTVLKIYQNEANVLS